MAKRLGQDSRPGDVAMGRLRFTALQGPRHGRKTGSRNRNCVGVFGFLPMRVLVACEFSGIVRDAFRKRGHQAYSCDKLPSERSGMFHIWSNVLEHLNGGGIEGKPWDLMIAHPPCTYLAVSGARWFKDRKEEQEKALEFVQKLMDGNQRKRQYAVHGTHGPKSRSGLVVRHQSN